MVQDRIPTIDGNIADMTGKRNRDRNARTEQNYNYKCKNWTSQIENTICATPYSGAFGHNESKLKM